MIALALDLVIQLGSHPYHLYACTIPAQCPLYERARVEPLSMVAPGLEFGSAI